MSDFEDRSKKIEEEKLAPVIYLDGIKTYNCPHNGKYWVSKQARPGERVLMGKKLYEIGKNGELKRIDKKRRRK
jgi:hypothetical protein